MSSGTATHLAAQVDQALKKFQPTNKLRQEFPAPNPLGNDSSVTLTNAGFDLLSRLLALDPAQRISAKDALNHEWCAHDGKRFKQIGENASRPQLRRPHAPGSICISSTIVLLQTYSDVEVFRFAWRVEAT